MEEKEARAVLRDHLQSYRQRPYRELVALVGEPQVTLLRGASGASYQVEVEVLWDHRPGGTLRVLGSVDDGGWRALKPLNDDFVVGPDSSAPAG